MPLLDDSREKILAVLVSAPAIFFFTLLIGRVLRRRAGVHLGILYQCFAGALAIFLPLWILNINWVIAPSPKGDPLVDRFNLLRELGVVTFILAMFFFLALLRRFLWELYFEKARGIAIPKFLSQVVAILVITIGILMVSGVAYRKDATVLLAGSTIAAAIIGFAMQDLLGNIISGVALQVSKPYKEGDWLLVDGQYAEVMEINWRSTRLRNNDNIYLDVPNSTIVKNTIVNVNYHTRFYGMRLRVGIDYGVPPNKVKQILEHAATHAKGVLRTPPPKVFLADFADSAITYEVKFHIENHRFYSDTTDAIRTAIWYELHRHGISIPFPIRTFKIDRQVQREERRPVVEKAKSLVRRQSFFGCLDEAQIERLLSNSHLLSFGRGELIIEKGAEGDSMFVLAKGTASVHLNEDGEGEPVAVLKTGDCFGEMSLLTGEPRSATVAARSDCEVLEVGKETFAEILSENERLYQEVSELLAHRKMENEGVLHREGAEKAMIAERERQYAAGFLARIRTFFEL